MTATLFPLTKAGFAIVTIVYFMLLLKEIQRAVKLSAIDESKKKRFVMSIIVSLIGWAVFVAVWSFTGMLSNFSIFPFNMGPILAIPLIASIIFTFFSKTFSGVLSHIPQHRIAYLQSFRIFVEILIWMLFVDNLLPIQMTFEGLNFDVISGVTGVIVGYLSSQGKLSRTVLIIWNVACLALLINIVTIAVLSMPVPFRVFMNEPSNTIVGQFPISLLPAMLVPLAYILHFFSLRKLFKK
jgi:hypothetical protein